MFKKNKIIWYFFEPLKKSVSIFFMAFLEVKLRYKKTLLGPIWLTISSGILILVLNLIFTNFINTGTDYILNLAIGIISWTFVSSFIIDSNSIFENNKEIMLQTKIPAIFFLYKCLLLNIIILLHNVLLIPLIILIFNIKVEINIFLLLYSFLSLIILTFFLVLINSIISLRFKDFGNMVNSILQISYFATPIVWSPYQISNEKLLSILQINPYYHIFENFKIIFISNYHTSVTNKYLLIFIFITVSLSIYFFYSKKDRIKIWL
jgi:lipopolysaccharide transport system permease protein